MGILRCKFTGQRLLFDVSRKKKKYSIRKIAGWSSIAACVLLCTFTVQSRGQVSILGSITEINLKLMVNL